MATEKPGVVVNGRFIGGALNGVHRVAYRLSKELLANGAADALGPITVLSPKLASPNAVFADLPREEVDCGVGRGQGWEQICLPRKATNRLALNFCNQSPLLGRNVMMLHDVQFYLFPDDYSSKQRFYSNVITPRLCRAATAVLTVSEYSKEKIVEFGLAKAEKVHVVYNGVDHIYEKAAEAVDYDALGVTPGRYIVCVSNMKRYKNVPILFDAFHDARLSDVKLLIVGRETRADFEAKGFQPPANAVFASGLSDGQLRAIYENALALGFPSLTEGFGLPPVEAMACGCPVVAARAGAMPEVLGDAAEYADPEDAASWVEAIAHLAGDEARRVERVEAGRARAERYTWRAAGETLKATLQTIV